MAQREPRTQVEMDGNNINYHGGEVIAHGINIYYIWYGDWNGDIEATSILTALANGIGGSPYFNINTTYSGMTGGRMAAVSNSVHFAGAIEDHYSQGVSLSMSGVASVVQRAIVTGLLPADSQGVYFVLSSADVTEDGFCQTGCGWHGYGSFANGTLTVNQTNADGVDIKFAFVGNPSTQCIHFCSLWNANFPPPNGDPGGDAMASILAHELTEATNDPHMNAWFDFQGEESGDKCQWTFGSISRVPQGQANSNGVYNVQLGGRYFLLQQLWVNDGGGYCAASYR
jgi:hypothetical protein